MKHPPVATLVQATFVQLIDAQGRSRTLAAVGCPSCKGALIIAIKGLAPLHMQNVDAMAFIEALRRGPEFEQLHRSKFAADRRTHVQRFPGSESSWYLSYADGTDVCDFICSGRHPNSEPYGCGVALLPAQREAFADACLKELMNSATRTGVAAQA